MAILVTALVVYGPSIITPGQYVGVYPVVIGPYGGVTTTTVYWVVKETYTTTVTEYAGFAGPSYGWIVLLGFIAVLGLAVFYLVRKR
jgi:hypothetical protein